MLLYGFIGKCVYFGIVPLLAIMGKVGRPRVRVFIIQNNNVLLVKNWLSPQKWTLPGGGVGRRETEQTALQREIQEELGITITTTLLQHKGQFTLTQQLAPYRISLYVFNDERRSFNEARPDQREIIDAKWFSLDALPQDMASELRDALSRR